MTEIEYDRRANLHRPRTFEELRDAAHALIDEGYSDYGAAAVLDLAVEQVRRLIGSCPGCQ